MAEPINDERLVELRAMMVTRRYPLGDVVRDIEGLIARLYAAERERDDLRDRLSAIDTVLSNTFDLILNANDVFAPGDSQSVWVDAKDIPKLLEMSRRFGDDGVLAVICACYGGWEATMQKPTARFEEARAALRAEGYLPVRDTHEDEIEETERERDELRARVQRLRAVAEQALRVAERPDHDDLAAALDALIPGDLANPEPDHG